MGAIMGILIGPYLPVQIMSGGLSQTISENANWTIILSVLGLIGGVFALLRRAFFISLLFLLAGAFAVGPVFISTILTTFAAILSAISRRDYIPLFTLNADKKTCLECGQPLARTLAYREYYCFNCKHYRTLPRMQVQAAPMNEANNCTTCGGPLTFVSKYNRYFCARCNAYAPPAAQQSQ
jgi:predicted RNA-binding Zn-ribbon protein involved in translation (DUF1610 family)